MSKIEKIKNDAEQMATDSIIQSQAQKDQNEVHLAFGAIGGLRLVSKFIGVSTIKLLQQVRDREQYKSFGFPNFKDFLEESPLARQYAGISYKTFNNHENQMLAEGDELYELLNDFRIPISTRQLLAKNGELEISLDGDKLQIGEETYDLESTNVKDVIKDLAKETRRLSQSSAKSEKAIESLQDQLKTGTEEYAELQRAIDAQGSGTPYEQALVKAIGSLINLTLAAKDATVVEKSNRGREDIETLWKQMLVVRSALYQDNFAFVDDTNVTASGISKRAMQVLAENDDFGDEFEQ